MCPQNTQPQVRMGVTLSALVLAAAGAGLLFAPDEASGMLAPGSGRPILIQLLGAALLGWGASTWMVRGTFVGGIYGRAIVAGNQMHLMVGALLLVKYGLETDAAHPAYWVLTGLYVLGAVFFSYLMFFSSGLRDR
jgi:hypothetical protein